MFHDRRVMWLGFSCQRRILGWRRGRWSWGSPDRKTEGLRKGSAMRDDKPVEVAEPGAVGGGYGFDLGLLIAWRLEAERRHAREGRVAA